MTKRFVVPLVGEAQQLRKSPARFSSVMLLQLIVAMHVSGVCWMTEALSCSTASLQVDPATLLVTVAHASGGYPTSLVPAQSSSTLLDIRPETDVSAFLCYDPVQVNESVANRLCEDTFGVGFEGTVSGVPLAAVANSSVIATRFPAFANVTVTWSKSPTAAALQAPLLDRLRALSCQAGVFVDPASTSSGAAINTSCALCTVDSVTAGCASLTRISCTANVVLRRLSPYSPVRVVEPQQWANSTIAFETSGVTASSSPATAFAPPPRWFTQSLCPSSGSYTAILGAGYGVVGDEKSGFTSGLDVLQYGAMQFSLLCSGDGGGSSNCKIVPSVGPSATAQVSAVNASRALIVNCEDANRGTPPLNVPSQMRTMPADQCRFALTEASRIEVDVVSADALALQEIDAAAKVQGMSSVDMFLSGWCPVAANAPNLHRFRACSTAVFWGSIASPLCRSAGYDDAILLSPMSAAQVARANAASNVSGNQTDMLLRMRCPATYFPYQQIQQDFDACDMTWVAPSALSTAASSAGAAAAACTARLVRCYKVEQQEERIDWIFGAALFCFVYVGSMVVSTVKLYRERSELQQSVAGTLKRKRSRLRTRATKASSASGSTRGEVRHFNFSNNSDVTDLILGDAPLRLREQRSSGSSTTTTTDNPGRGGDRGSSRASLEDETMHNSGEGAVAVEL